MKTQFTFRNMETSEALISLTQHKITSNHSNLADLSGLTTITFSKDGPELKIRMSMVARDKTRVGTSARGQDMYQLLDTALEKMSRRLKRHKPKPRRKEKLRLIEDLDS